MMNFGKPLTPEQTAAYLRTLPAIRERCGRVHALAKEGKLQYFTYHPEKETDVAAFCADIMKVRIDGPDVWIVRSDGTHASSTCSATLGPSSPR